MKSLIGLIAALVLVPTAEAGCFGFLRSARRSVVVQPTVVRHYSAPVVVRSYSQPTVVRRYSAPVVVEPYHAPVVVEPYHAPVVVVPVSRPPALWLVRPLGTCRILNGLRICN